MSGFGASSLINLAVFSSDFFFPIQQNSINSYFLVNTLIVRGTTWIFQGRRVLGQKVNTQVFNACNFWCKYFLVKERDKCSVVL